MPLGLHMMAQILRHHFIFYDQYACLVNIVTTQIYM